MNLRFVLAASICSALLLPGLHQSGNELSLGNSAEAATRTASAAYHPGYRQVGTASWYGPGFHGRKTASGERFDRHRLTAAHRSLPLGTKARITNLENGRVVEVTVTDRGPYVPGRVIDLSEHAAQVLGMKKEGVAKVAIEIVPREALG